MPENRMLTVVLFAASLIFPISAYAQEEGGAGDKHLALFLGGGEEKGSSGERHSAKAQGLIFEYRITDIWGVGAAFERLDVHAEANHVIVIPVSYRFGGGFRAFAGPGYEFKAHGDEDKAIFRLGLSYSFEINESWGIAPEAVYDMLDGHGNTWLAGIAIEYRF
jgi:hypothetical protein